MTLWMVVAEDTGAIREDYYASSSPAPTTFPMAAKYKHERTVIVNGNATTCDASAPRTTPSSCASVAPRQNEHRRCGVSRPRRQAQRLRQRPGGFGGVDDGHVQPYFGELMAHSIGVGVGVGVGVGGTAHYRTTKSAGAAQDRGPLQARWSSGAKDGSGSTGNLGHASLGLRHYAHCSSPIRHFSDLLNQHAVFGTLDPRAVAGVGGSSSSGGSSSGLNVSAAALGSAVAALNKRCSVVARYHAMVDAMELAYRCRRRPMVFRGRVEVDGGAGAAGGGQGLSGGVLGAVAKADSGRLPPGLPRRAPLAAGVHGEAPLPHPLARLLLRRLHRFALPGAVTAAEGGAAGAETAVEPHGGDVEIFGVLLGGRQHAPAPAS